MGQLHDQRIAYGEELVALGRENPDVVVLEADLGKSTMSALFQQAYPNRYFEMGIAEQNMLSTAAGLALGGKIAFVNSFAVFATGRAYDQIRQTIAIGRLNVKICGSSAGLSDFGDGATHQSVDDIAIMRAIPGMTVLTPCDAPETRRAVRAAAAIDGPVYIRVSRAALPDIEQYEGGRRFGELSVLREGADVTLFAHGVMVHETLKAAEILERASIYARVVYVPIIKPFDEVGAAALSEGVKGVVTAEEHSVQGGLACAVALALRKYAVPMDYVAINDEFGQSAHSYKELMVHYGLTAENIAAKAKKLIGKESTV